MSKLKEFELPKYLKLNKGTIWRDVEGAGSSGVELIRTDFILVGRGNMKMDNDRPSHEQPEVSLDKNSNNVTVQDEYGYIDNKEDKSYFSTENIPKENLTKIIAAYRNGVLVDYDPTKPLEVKEPRKQVKNFRFNQDGDVVFVGKNKDIYNKLMRMNFKDIMREIDKMKDRNDLMDMYEYELNGYNIAERCRFDVMESLKKKLSEFGPTMSAIRINDLEGKVSKKTPKRKK